MLGLKTEGGSGGTYDRESLYIYTCTVHDRYILTVFVLLYSVELIIRHYYRFDLKQLIV